MSPHTPKAYLPARWSQASPEKPRNSCGCYLCTDCSSHGRNDFHVVYCPTHAAAPDLLAALEQAEEWMVQTGAPHSSATLAKARAAIRKAKAK